MTESNTTQTETDKTDVIVIGGGIIGTSCACALAQRGAKVTLIEKGQIGLGCSYGNAGWLTPCFAEPLPMPGMLMTCFKWLLDPDSPLYIKFRLDWEFIRWMTRFLVSMNHRQMHASFHALVELAKYSLEAYAKMDAENPGEFSYKQKGMLSVASSQSALDAIKLHLEHVSQHGVVGRMLEADEVRRLEPALTCNEIAGGVHFPDEAQCEPLETVQAMGRRAERLGAVILSDTEVFDVEFNHKRIEAMRTTRGRICADQYVLAAGSWSTRIGKKLGMRVPVLAGKGYAVIVEPFEPRPSMPLMLADVRVGIAPRSASIRLAGTLELVDSEDQRITARRVDAIIGAARRFLNVPQPPKIVEVWRGLRPCTPDGVPIIGRPQRYDNLVLATGHQMLGLLAAPATGQLVAEIISGADTTFDPQPFRPARF